MKIIQEGKLPINIWQATCNSCKAVLEEVKEKLKIESCPREGYSFAHETCPCCQQKVIFYPKKES